MTKHRNDDEKRTDSVRTVESDDTIARLMSLAGPRAAIPPDLQQRVHDRVRNEWRSVITRKRAIRWSLPVAVAATVLLVVTFASRPPNYVVTPIATVARVGGESGSSGLPLAVGDNVYAGDRIEAPAGGIGLAFDGGLSLRIAVDSVVTLAAVDELTLTSGRVYLDTGRSLYPGRRMTVHTSVGTATDIGTQFAVSYLDDDAMSVAVREGRVDVTGARKTYTAQAGSKLMLTADHAVTTAQLAVYDDSWHWAEALAPAFEIDNRSLLDFLQWASRETGKELIFESDRVRVAAMRTILRGTIADLAPSEALASVMPTTSFNFSIDDRRIVIGQ